MNIILIVIDTLRSDFVGCYGGKDDPTPNIDSLAANGLRFETCISQAPWTTPSVGTILTGLYPSEHGADGIFDKLPDTVHHLAERLQSAGYNTGAVVSHSLVGSKRGFHRGFHFFDESNALGHRYVSSDGITHISLQWMRATSEPFFLFIHYFDPHYYYVEHEGYTKTHQYTGMIDSSMTIWDIRNSMGRMTPEDLQYLRELYAGEISYLDSYIGKLVGFLEENELDSNTVLILTADHGEEFGEHGWIGHTRNLYGNLLRVPLVIYSPHRFQAGIRKDPAMLIDICPTILRMAGLSTEDLPGKDLLQDDLTGRPLISEVNYEALRFQKRAIMQSVQVGKWKVIRDIFRGKWELFDTSIDPGESNNLALKEPGILRNLQIALSQWVTSRDSIGTESLNLSPEEVEKLRSLGYIQ